MNINASVPSRRRLPSPSPQRRVQRMRDGFSFEVDDAFANDLDAAARSSTAPGVLTSAIAAMLNERRTRSAQDRPEKTGKTHS